MTDEITYVYLICGPSRELRLQLRYSLATLIAECPEAAGRIVIYTDDPAAIAKLSRDVRIVDVRDDIREMTADWTYVYRAKPVVTADALQRFGGSCVFLDADSFF